MPNSQHAFQLHMPAPARSAKNGYWRYLAAGDHARKSAPLWVAWAAGRANLIGEHTDYNLGWVLPVALDRVIALAGRPSNMPIARLYSLHHQRMASFSLAADALADDTQQAALPYWARFIRGVWRELMELDALPPMNYAAGFSAAIGGNIPVGGGLSSSAALEVAAATFAQALGARGLPPLTVAHLCQRAEQRSVGVRVGIMDQAASCLGRPGHAILLDCRSLAYEYVPVNLPDLALAVFDTRVPHTLATSGYNERRAQCEEAVALLASILQAETLGREVSSLRDITSDDLARHGDALSEVLLRRARHVVSENARTLAAAEALRAGDGEALGALLYASHASLRDDYEVSCRELDVVVEIARETPGVLGARMMGAGFGGNALVLVRQASLVALEARLSAEYSRRTGRIGALRPCRIGGPPEHARMQRGER